MTAVTKSGPSIADMLKIFKVTRQGSELTPTDLEEMSLDSFGQCQVLDRETDAPLYGSMPRSLIKKEGVD